MNEAAGGLVMLLFAVVLVAVLTQTLTASAASGGLDRNRVSGIRTRATMANDDAWRAGHAAALPVVGRISWVASATVVACVVVWALEGSAPAVAVGMAGLMVEVGVLLWAVVLANRAARGAGPQK